MASTIDPSAAEVGESPASHAEAGAVHTEVGHESGGMPQLDFETFGPQLVWLAISFALLYVLMARVALPRIGTVLEERRDKIADDLDKAENLKQQADHALEGYEKALDQARNRAHSIAGDRRAKLQLETDKMRAGVDERLAAKTEAAEQRIAATKDAALGNLKDVAAEVAAEITAKLIGETLDAESIERAVEAAITRR